MLTIGTFAIDLLMSIVVVIAMMVMIAPGGRRALAGLRQHAVALFCAVIWLTIVAIDLPLMLRPAPGALFIVPPVAAVLASALCVGYGMGRSACRRRTHKSRRGIRAYA